MKSCPLFQRKIGMSRNGSAAVKDIRKVAFIYLMQGGGEYYVTDDPGYSIQRRPQLGLQYLCAVLEMMGITTTIFDQTVLGLGLQELIECLNGYDIAGFYCSDAQEYAVKDYCERIKEKLNIPLLVGGPSTYTNSTFLDHGCDIVVHGEGEITIRDIIRYYEGKTRIEDIKGISYKLGDKVMTAPPQELIMNLDTLPFPDRSKVDVHSYYDYFLFGMRKPYVTMMASRGCAYRCSFCTSCNIWEFKYRRRSPDNVIAEIDEVVNAYHVRYIAFQDDIFGIENSWIEEFCGKLIQRPYKIRWMVILHPFIIRKETERILRMMKDAGCDTLSFGLQSAHPQILRNINRHPAEPQQLATTLKIANRLGFATAVGYIFGLPGDTQETVRCTIDYSLRCGSTLANFYILSVLKGSELETKYRGRKVCDLTERELVELSGYASRKFYTRSKTVLSIAYFIAKNPRWVVQMGARLPSLLARTGFVKTRKK